MGRKISQRRCSFAHHGPGRHLERGPPAAQAQSPGTQTPASTFTRSGPGHVHRGATPTEKGRGDARRACVRARARAAMAEWDVPNTEGSVSGQVLRLRGAPQLQLGPAPQRRYRPPESPTARQGPRGLSALRPAAWVALTFRRHGRARGRLVRGRVPEPAASCRRPSPHAAPLVFSPPRGAGAPSGPAWGAAPSCRRLRFARRSGRGFGRRPLKERRPGEERFPARRINPSDKKKKKKKIGGRGEAPAGTVLLTCVSCVCRGEKTRAPNLRGRRSFASPDNVASALTSLWLHSR